MTVIRHLKVMISLVSITAAQNVTYCKVKQNTLSKIMTPLLINISMINDDLFENVSFPLQHEQPRFIMVTVTVVTSDFIF